MSLFDSAPLGSIDDGKRPLAERMRPEVRRQLGVGPIRDAANFYAYDSAPRANSHRRRGETWRRLTPG